MPNIANFSCSADVVYEPEEDNILCGFLRGAFRYPLPDDSSKYSKCFKMGVVGHLKLSSPVPWRYGVLTKMWSILPLVRRAFTASLNQECSTFLLTNWFETVLFGLGESASYVSITDVWLQQTGPLLISIFLPENFFRRISTEFLIADQNDVTVQPKFRFTIPGPIH